MYVLAGGHGPEPPLSASVPPSDVRRPPSEFSARKDRDECHGPARFQDHYLAIRLIRSRSLPGCALFLHGLRCGGGRNYTHLRGEDMRTTTTDILTTYLGDMIAAQ